MWLFQGPCARSGFGTGQAYLEQQHQEELARRQREEERREEERQATLAQQRHEQLLEVERQKVELARVAFEEQLVEEREARKQREAQRARQRAEQEVAAIVEALKSPDAAVQATAFETATASDDPRLRHQALSHFLSQAKRLLLSQAKRLPIQLSTGAQSDESAQYLLQNLGPFALDIADFDQNTGRISGQFIAGQARGQFYGTLSGDSLAVASDICQFEARLSGDRALRGRLRCANAKLGQYGQIYSGELQAVLPVY